MFLLIQSGKGRLTGALSAFTFHNVSINTGGHMADNNLYPALHSIMFLLILRDGNGSGQQNDLYIP